MQRALVQVVLIAVCAGLVGVHVVLRRSAFFVETLQHTIFPGIVVAYIVGTSLLLGAAVAAALTVALVAFLGARRHFDQDALLAVTLTAFLGFGVLLVSQRSSYQHDLTALLFGRLLTLSWSTVTQTAVIAVVVAVVVVALHKELLFRGFDGDGYAAAGYRPRVLDVVLQGLVAAVVVAAVQAVGTVLLIGLIVTPALIARRLTMRPAALMVASVAIVTLAAVMALVGSYRLSLTYDVAAAPAAITVLLLTGALVVVSAITAVTARRASVA